MARRARPPPPPCQRSAPHRTLAPRFDGAYRPSESVAREASELRSSGASDGKIAERLEELAVYQLQHVRPFSEFVLSFPAEMRAFELGPGFMLRSRLLFETFADSARAQLRALDGLGARLGSLRRGPRSRPRPRDRVHSHPGNPSLGWGPRTARRAPLLTPITRADAKAMCQKQSVRWRVIVAWWARPGTSSTARWARTRGGFRHS